MQDETVDGLQAAFPGWTIWAYGSTWHGARALTGAEIRTGASSVLSADGPAALAEAIASQDNQMALALIPAPRNGLRPQST